MFFEGMLKIILGLTEKESGKLIEYTGNEIPW